MVSVPDLGFNQKSATLRALLLPGCGSANRRHFCATRSYGRWHRRGTVEESGCRPRGLRCVMVTVHCSCTLHMSRAPVSLERRVVYTGFELAPPSRRYRRAARARRSAATARWPRRHAPWKSQKSTPPSGRTLRNWRADKSTAETRQIDSRLSVSDRTRSGQNVGRAGPAAFPLIKEASRCHADSADDEKQ